MPAICHSPTGSPPFLSLSLFSALFPFLPPLFGKHGLYCMPDPRALRNRKWCLRQTQRGCNIHSAWPARTRWRRREKICEAPSVAKQEGNTTNLHPSVIFLLRCFRVFPLSHGQVWLRNISSMIAKSCVQQKRLIKIALARQRFSCLTWNRGGGGTPTSTCHFQLKEMEHDFNRLVVGCGHYTTAVNVWFFL